MGGDLRYSREIEAFKASKEGGSRMTHLEVREVPPYVRLDMTCLLSSSQVRTTTKYDSGSLGAVSVRKQ